MTLSQAPTFFLEAPAFPARRASRMRIHWFDYAFFTLALIGICGGALFLLELGSAQSSGQGSFFARFMEEAAVWLPVVSQKLTTYGLLFLASVKFGGHGALCPSASHDGSHVQPLTSAPLACFQSSSSASAFLECAGDTPAACSCFEPRRLFAEPDHPVNCFGARDLLILAGRF
jgi:hypothetical protein